MKMVTFSGRVAVKEIPDGIDWHLSVPLTHVILHPFATYHTIRLAKNIAAGGEQGVKAFASEVVAAGGTVIERDQKTGKERRY